VISKPGKMTKGVKKWKKRPKKSINRSWQLIFTITIRKLTKSRKSPFSEEVDSGSFSGQNELILRPSKYNIIPLAFQYFNFSFILVFEGGISPKMSVLVCTWDFQGQTTYVLEKKTLYPRTYVTVANIARIHLCNLGKNKMKEITSSIFPWNRMYVHWREREHEDIDILVEEDPTTIATLKKCGIWKFFQFPFMREQPILLNALVDYRHPDVEALMLEGQLLNSMTEDI
jgi:hypothetical protein